MEANEDVNPVRFELKFLVRDETARRISDYVRGYLELEPWGVGQPDQSYTVHTVYLDAANLRLYWNAIDDPEHRWQLRLRYYSAGFTSPVFCEVKQWNGDMTRLHSCRIRQEQLSKVMGGRLREFEQIQPEEPMERAALQRFMTLREGFEAHPRLHVRYDREAYQDESRQVRVNLDRHIYCQPHRELELTTVLDEPSHILTHHVLLELKYTGKYPHWFGDLVESLELLEEEFDKYVVCIAAVEGLALGWQKRDTQVHSRDQGNDSFRTP